MVAGVRVVGEDIFDVDASLDSTFEPCLFAAALKVPLVAMRGSPTGNSHSFYRISRFMTNPQSGIADIDWCYGGQCGPAPPVFLARTDGIPFRTCDFVALEDFLLSLFDNNDYPMCLRIVTQSDFLCFLTGKWEQSSQAFLNLRFPKDSWVRACKLQTQHLNGKIGVVNGKYESGRVGVLFPPPYGCKAVRPDNLSLELNPDSGLNSSARATERSMQQKLTGDIGTPNFWQEACEHGLLYQLPTLLDQNTFPATQWEFGIQYAGLHNCNTSVLPLRISVDSRGGFVALPLGGMIACDWWRGRRSETLPVTVYKAKPKPRNFETLEGVLCCGDEQSDVMSEPQAWCHPCRVKLLVRRLAKPWQCVGAVEDLDDLLQTYCTESHRYAVQWTVDGGGWQPNGVIAGMIREVMIRKCGRALQISPSEGEVAWEIPKMMPSCRNMKRGCSESEDELPELAAVEYVMVLGRECFVKDVDYEHSSLFQWYFRRQRHCAKQYASIPSPSFSSALMYVCEV